MSNAWKCKRWGHRFQGSRLPYTSIRSLKTATPGVAREQVRCSRCQRCYWKELVYDYAAMMCHIWGKHAEKMFEQASKESYFARFFEKPNI